MLDADIRTLDGQTAQRSLDGLEADIWAAVEARVRTKRLLTIAVPCQAAVLAIGLVVSIAAGQYFAGMSSSTDALTVFTARTDLAPSSLLIGR